MKKLYYSPIVGLIPLAVMTGFAVDTVWKIMSTNPGFQVQHYGGLILVVLNIIAFFVHYKSGILVTGLTTICGLIGLISLTPYIRSFSIMIGGLTVIRFEPLFLLFAVLHFILSGRYYVGIARELYWKNFCKKDWIWPGK
jgi:hypothetical protein